MRRTRPAGSSEGDGGGTDMSKSEDEPPHELENQFILRLPPEHASTVRNIMRSGSAARKDKIKIDLSSDGRHAVVEVDNVSLSAKLVDLPCVVGSLKTFDRKTFYKTADISQMLVCQPAGNLQSSPEKSVASADLSGTRNEEKEVDKKYTWKHGITPPLKNVRKKRFRKVKQKYMEAPDVEKEVKRLLCSDSEAISARWEVITDEETKEIESQGYVPNTPLSSAMGASKQGDTTSEFDVLQDTFRDSSSNTHDDEDECEEKEEEDDEDDDEEGEEDNDDDFEEALERQLRAKIIEYSQHKTKEGARSVVTEIQKNIHFKERKIQKIHKKAERQRNIIRKVESLALKNHLKCVLTNLKTQEKETYGQITCLQVQLNHFMKK
ncbi:transcription initiation factor TFIID subunit 7-like isoform X1 [Octodon degus]|uniref:Transcription initiation factor TFIID subunit 7-like isoform X1 n=1 Tax=Octodon degus TaxID=10160 RepID=A0A6P6DGV2_OCTDE|nr:transcription initiation factor TFIID subunit 7-like isoform X1 [Octodon degus]